MGATHVLVTIRHRADASRSWKGRFLMDTGAIDSVVPESVLRGIGIEPQTVRSYELADGTVRDFGVGTGDLEILGEIVGATLIFGTDDPEPLLGCTALESDGFEVDRRSQSLRKLPAIRLKAAMRAAGLDSRSRSSAAFGSWQTLSSHFSRYSRASSSGGRSIGTAFAGRKSARSGSVRRRGTKGRPDLGAEESAHVGCSRSRAAMTRRIRGSC